MDWIFLFGWTLILWMALAFYALPSAIAAIRHARYSPAIVLINLLFGWTVLGWVAALIWAIVERPAEPRLPMPARLTN